jgi:hypothetical protein
VIAVEPVDEMRRALRRTSPEADARAGTAERTSHRAGHWRPALHHSELFETTAKSHFPNVQTLDAESLAFRVASTSFIADLPGPERRRVLERARAIAADLPDRFPFPYTTEIEVLARR